MERKAAMTEVAKVLIGPLVWFLLLQLVARGYAAEEETLSPSVAVAPVEVFSDPSVTRVSRRSGSDPSEVVLVVSQDVSHLAVIDLEHPADEAAKEVAVMADQYHRPCELLQGRE
jgi:hypothetical protein